MSTETQTATKTVYQMDQNTRFKYATLFLLSEMINFQRYVHILLVGQNEVLTELLAFMRHNDLIEIKDDHYVPTQKGRDYLVNFYAKYFEFLKIFDVYCAVDLDKGEFAFEKFFDMNDDEWFAYLDQPRFSDVRVAVAEFKNKNTKDPNRRMDPVEIVFMSFLNEGRFSSENPGWQQDLVNGKVWDEIVNICNTAIPLVDLSNDGVIENIVERGSKLMLELLKKEEDNKKTQEEPEEIEETVTTTTTEYVDIVDPPYYDYDYFYPYYDPYYISPVWLAAAIILL